MRRIRSIATLAMVVCLSLVTSLAIALTPNPVEKGAPKYGGVIRFVQIAGPGGYDLHTRPAWAGSPLVPMFSNLIQFNPAYQEITVDNLVGDLAERFEISPDGKVITFWLRKNVQWHDGKPFSADDVVYSMNKMTDPSTGSRVAGWLTAFDRIEKVDDYTVKIYAKYASPGFLVNLANAYCVILPKHTAGIDSKSTDFLVGTGPFKFKEYVTDARFSVVRNENYFKKDDAGRQLPYLDGIDVIIGRGTAGTDALIARRIQLLNPIQGVQRPEDIDRIKRAAPEVQLTPTGGNLPYLIWLNQEFEPFKNPKVREAIGLIYSQEDDIIARFGSLDFGRVGPGLFPRNFGIDPSEVTKIMGWDRSWDERVKRAQQLMKEAGYEKGFKIRMLYGAYPGSTSEPSMLVLGDKLKRYLNIEYEMLALQFAEMHKVRADTGAWDMTNEIIYALLPDPDVYMSYFKTGDRSNFTKYSNPEVDRLWDLQNREMNANKRIAILQDIERKLIADRVILPGAFAIARRASYPSVKNMRYTQQTYGSESKMEDVWLDE
jgi:peptide/nickel transport system substrate-binding protein